MKWLDSKVVVLNGQKYIVYLKLVNVKHTKAGESRTAIKAFVRKMRR